MILTSDFKLSKYCRVAVSARVHCLYGKRDGLKYFLGSRRRGLITSTARPPRNWVRIVHVSDRCFCAAYRSFLSGQLNGMPSLQQPCERNGHDFLS